MALAWIAPAALLGIALVVLPIAIHLLVRQHARTLAYPSLRFLRETQLAAFRRRTIQDALLLLCRAAIIATAAVALAGPIVQTVSRTSGYAGRTSRAIVTLEGADRDLVTRITDDAFASRAFDRATLSDSLADAVRWLDRQPPSAREVVIAGVLRRGSVSEADLAEIANEIGVRFVPVPAMSPADVPLPALTRRDGELVRVERAVHFGVDTTRVVEGRVMTVPDDLVTIIARPADTPLAQAALRAALDAGVPWSDFERRIVIAWPGADDAAIARVPPTQILRMPVPVPLSSAADAVLATLGAASPRPDGLEPVMITADQLSSWSRAPGAPSATAPLADEGDRRWLWGAVLALLAVEAWMRRSRPEPAASRAAQKESRVA